MEKITLSIVERLRKGNEEFLLLNVLPVESFRKEHIPGSKNVPYDDVEFVQKVEALVPSKADKIVIYSGGIHCNKAIYAAKLLDQSGFSSIFEFPGGIEEWKKSGNLIETGFAKHHR